MQWFHWMWLSPMTGDNSPQKNIVVFVILGVALAAALVLGLWKDKK